MLRRHRLNATDRALRHDLAHSERLSRGVVESTRRHQDFQFDSEVSRRVTNGRELS